MSLKKGVKKEFDSLKRKLNTYAGEINFITKKGRSALSEPEQVCNFKGAMKTLEKYYSLFESVYEELLDFEIIPDGAESTPVQILFPTEEEKSLRLGIKGYYYECLGILEKLIAAEKKREYAEAKSARTTVMANTTPGETTFQFSPSHSLPKLNLPKFSGQILEWRKFHDSFVSMVHNEQMCDTKKFHYLLSSLSGQAAGVINRFQIEDKNYQLAWKALCDTYDSKRLLASAYLNQILGFKPQHGKPTVDSMNEFLIKISENVEAFKLLKIEDEAGFILFHLTIRCLDSITREHFEIENKNTEFPTFDLLTNFVKNRSLSLRLAAGCNINFDYSPLDNYSKFNNQISKVSIRNSPKSHSKPSLLTNDSNNGAKSKENSNSIVCSVCDENRHSLVNCKKFTNASVPERLELIKGWKGCRNCLSTHHFTKECGSKWVCRWCKQKHHSYLCKNASNSQVDNNRSHSTPVNSSDNTSNVSPQGSVLNTTMHFPDTQVLLGTAVAEIRDSRGYFQTIRIVIDSASHYSFLTQRCIKRLGLFVNKCTKRISGIGQTLFEGAQGQVQCCIKPRNKASPNLTTSAIVVKEITSLLPTAQLPYEIWKQYLKFPLADPSFYEPAPIDFLLGADMFCDIWSGSGIIIRDDIPKLFPTIFGHVVTGKFHEPNTQNGSSLLTLPMSDDINFDLKQFWELEEPTTPTTISNPEDDECEAHFTSTHYRRADGSYVVRLPFKATLPKFSNTSFMALKRFQNLETKLEKIPELRSGYNQFMLEYENLHHMTCSLSNPKFVIPHHAILKEDRNKTKIRVVFDGSAKSVEGSLNDHLMIGPKLQNDIRDILLNFRSHPIVFVTDIVKMYRNIWLDPSDRNYQCIFWRYSPLDELKIFELNTITYGLSSSPFLALRVIRQLVHDEGELYPKASRVLERDIFIDDICTGSDSVSNATELLLQVVALLKKGNFSLSKWATNCPELLKHVSISPDSNPISFSTDDNTSLKILGLQWVPNHDYFTYSIRYPSSKPTKRGILSTIAKLYDPLGFLSPFIILMKMFIQELWKIGVDWDEPISAELEFQWSKTIAQIESLSEIQIPRFIGMVRPFDYQIIGFSDSSIKSYCAAVYIRSIKGSDIKVHLLIAKTKLAPLKVLSVPRLELCGALLLSRLYNSLSGFLEILGESSQRPIFFTDSSIVLSWLHTPTYNLKTFVANRVVEITNIIPAASWRHVQSSDNPADCRSRGLYPNDLVTHDIWWYGPEWLSFPLCEWPESIFSVPNEVPEMKNISTLVTTNDVPKETFLIEIMKRFSSFSKLLRVVALILRLFANSRMDPTLIKRTGPIQTSEIENALSLCIKSAQLYYFFNNDIKNAQGAIQRFIKLNPFFDSSGILRAGGRLFHANIPYNHKHPVLLPPKCHLTILIVDYFHKVYLHPGPSLLQALIQTKYWIPSIRRVVQQRTFYCIKCYKLKAKSPNPMMSDLPSFRVQRSRPFSRIGIDFAGPFVIKESHRRKAATSKAYMCLIVCLVTKALHLEPVTSLSGDAFLAAFDRFTSRRGLPSEVHSDCGKNFVAASNRLKDLWKWYNDEYTRKQIIDHVNFKGIKWMFNPPLAPHMGGIWEAGVKSSKQLLQKIAGDTPLTFEEMSTLFSKIEAILNSRPLCPLSSHPSECEYLSPAHFLIGDLLTTVPEPSLLEEKLNHLDRWQLLKRMSEHFWTRWKQEYLSNLLTRSKWTSSTPNPKIGDLVLLKDNYCSPVQQWPLARISDLHPGRDGIVRIVTVSTPSSSYKRPLVKLVPLLPLTSDPFQA